MFKYYSGIALMCVVFAILAVFFSRHGVQLACIYTGVASVFLGIGFLTNKPESRW